MKLLDELISRISILEKENKILKATVKSLGTQLGEITVKIKSSQIEAPSPEKVKTLDTNNIWMGIKVGNTYQYMGKLRVYYDEERDEWFSAPPLEEGSETKTLEETIEDKVTEMLDDPETFEELIDLQEYETSVPDKVVTNVTLTGSTLMVHKAPPYAIYYPG